jgi:hypothetical protein
MKPWILGLLLLAISSPALAFEKGEVWRGSYIYRTGQPPVQFTLFITNAHGGGRFSGVIVEPNTLGDRTFSELFADVTGSDSGATFSFAKTYDGTGGQIHTVQYSGELAAGTSGRARGRWVSGPNLNGTFEMHRR